MTCGCGKACHYYDLFGAPACNRYFRCLTGDEAIEALKEANIKIILVQELLGSLSEYDFDHNLHRIGEIVNG